jgi:hypothetical protein
LAPTWNGATGKISVTAGVAVVPSGTAVSLDVELDDLAWPTDESLLYLVISAGTSKTTATDWFGRTQTSIVTSTSTLALYTPTEYANLAESSCVLLGVLSYGVDGYSIDTSSFWHDGNRPTFTIVDLYHRSLKGSYDTEFNAHGIALSTLDLNGLTLLHQTASTGYLIPNTTDLGIAGTSVTQTFTTVQYDGIGKIVDPLHYYLMLPSIPTSIPSCVDSSSNYVDFTWVEHSPILQFESDPGTIAVTWANVSDLEIVPKQTFGDQIDVRAVTVGPVVSDGVVVTPKAQSFDLGTYAGLSLDLAMGVDGTGSAVIVPPVLDSAKLASTKNMTVDAVTLPSRGQIAFALVNSPNQNVLPPPTGSIVVTSTNFIGTRRLLYTIVNAAVSTTPIFTKIDDYMYTATVSSWHGDLKYDGSKVSTKYWTKNGTTLYLKASVFHSEVKRISETGLVGGYAYVTTAAATGATSLTVEALKFTISSGTVLTFGTVSVTTTADAAKGDSTLSVSAISDAIAAGTLAIASACTIELSHPNLTSGLVSAYYGTTALTIVNVRGYVRLTSVATAGATSLSVSVLPVDVPSGTTISFGSVDVVTNADTLAGAVSLPVVAISATIAAGTSAVVSTSGTPSSTAVLADLVSGTLTFDSSYAHEPMRVRYQYAPLYTYESVECESARFSTRYVETVGTKTTPTGIAAEATLELLTNSFDTNDVIRASFGSGNGTVTLTAATTSSGAAIATMEILDNDTAWATSDVITVSFGSTNQSVVLTATSNFTPGSSKSATAIAIAIALNANTFFARRAVASSTDAAVTVTSSTTGTAGNSYSLSAVSATGLNRFDVSQFAGGGDWGVGTDMTETAANIMSALNANSLFVKYATASSSGALVSLTSLELGTTGNSYTLSASSSTGSNKFDVVTFAGGGSYTASDDDTIGLSFMLNQPLGDLPTGSVARVYMTAQIDKTAESLIYYKLADLELTTVGTHTVPITSALVDTIDSSTTYDLNDMLSITVQITGLDAAGSEITESVSIDDVNCFEPTEPERYRSGLAFSSYVYNKLKSWTADVTNGGSSKLVVLASPSARDSGVASVGTVAYYGKTTQVRDARVLMPSTLSEAHVDMADALVCGKALRSFI